MFEEMCEKFGYVYKNNVLLTARGPLSNFWGGFKGQEFPIEYEIQVSPLDFETIQFNTTEQIYMAEKASFFSDWKTLNLILDEKNPWRQRELGQTVLGFNDRAWGKFKFTFMLSANRAKFDQNQKLKDFLTSVPRHCIIAESTPDKEWGSGIEMGSPGASDVSKWTGNNLMGRVLMEVRQKL